MLLEVNDFVFGFVAALWVAVGYVAVTISIGASGAFIALAVLLTAATLHHRPRKVFYDLVSRRFEFLGPSAGLRISVPLSIAGLAGLVLTWVVYGTAVFVVAGTLNSAGYSNPWPLIGALATAWAAGFLIPGLPGGLGVRELTLTALLAPVYPIEVGATLAIMARIMLMGSEALLAGAALLAASFQARRTSR